MISGIVGYADLTLGAAVDEVLEAHIAASPERFRGIRHATAKLAERQNRQKLLLVLTDGKPNDIDYYEGRFGIEDTRRAVMEARRSGVTVFGVTVDREAQSYFPTLFGRGGYTIVGQVAKLPSALPAIYRHLVR